MRRGFGLIGLVVTTILVIIVAAIAYNLGWSQGVATHLPEGAAAAGAPYYYSYHPFGWGGFGFFGILWFLLIIFGLFWLFRLAFFGRRYWGGGGWGYKGGHFGQGVPPGIEERLQDWHKRAHGESSPTPPPPPSDQRTV
jgi:hypothetical protein